MLSVLIATPLALAALITLFHAYEDARAEARDNAHHGFDTVRVLWHFVALALAAALAYTVAKRATPVDLALYLAASLAAYAAVRWLLFDGLLNVLRARPWAYVARARSVGPDDASEFVGALLIRLGLASVELRPIRRGETQDVPVWMLNASGWLVRLGTLVLSVVALAYWASRLAV